MDYIIFSIEDDEDIRRILNVSLTHEGYKVYSFENAKEFYEKLKEIKPQMILLDMMLPDMSGTEILKDLRRNPEYDEVEILIISANHMLVDKIEGLNLGADDYIEKPFELMELFSRIKSKTRRYFAKQNVEFQGFSLDSSKREIQYNGVILDLTNKEFQILELLIQKKGNIVTKEELIKKIWGDYAVLETRTIDMHMKHIRNKIQDTDGKKIQTIYGVGFKIAS